MGSAASKNQLAALHNLSADEVADCVETLGTDYLPVSKRIRHEPKQFSGKKLASVPLDQTCSYLKPWLRALHRRGSHAHQKLRLAQPNYEAQVLRARATNRLRLKYAVTGIFKALRGITNAHASLNTI
jgi:hypothetical protein